MPLQPHNVPQHGMLGTRATATRTLASLSRRASPMHMHVLSRISLRFAPRDRSSRASLTWPSTTCFVTARCTSWALPTCRPRTIPPTSTGRPTRSSDAHGCAPALWAGLSWWAPSLRRGQSIRRRS
eukprot:scaffold18871_cov69-Phaeocystis_antarctica.AAC.6